jgi:uncharacterized protein YcgI (DUF1989 family)
MKMSTALDVIPARSGKAVPVRRGQLVQVVNTHGSQVIDTWAFSTADPNEHMSMEHTRAGSKQLALTIDGQLLTNRRSPILTVTQDTSPGIHDTLIAACDIYRYQSLGHVGHHENCTENLHKALAEVNCRATHVPCPLNLFMNIPVVDANILQWKPPTSRPGDFIEFRAEMDCVLVFSACPMDLLPINGESCEPTEAHYRIL